MLRRPLRRSPFPGPQIAGTTFRDLQLFVRLWWRVALHQPQALGPLARAFYWALRYNRGAVKAVFSMAAFYLHLGPFSRYVIEVLDKRIAALDAGDDAFEHIAGDSAVAQLPAIALAGD